MLSCVGTLALFVSAVTPISTVTAPVAEAAPQTRQLITPIGYKMVNGKQDRENPLSAPDLLVDLRLARISVIRKIMKMSLARMIAMR